MMDRPKVLVVDDDADLRRTVSFLLGSVCEVLEASNGPDALDIVRRQHPALMLLDLVMPDMDGAAVLAAARSLDPRIIVIMLTGEQELELAERTLALGAAEYVTKPFDVDFLRDEVRRLLAGRKPDGDDGPPWRVEPDPKT